MNKITETTIQNIEQFCFEYGLSYARFGILAVNNNKIYKRLKSGKGVSTRTIQRLEEYMATNNKNRGDA